MLNRASTQIANTDSSNMPFSLTSKLDQDQHPQKTTASANQFSSEAFTPRQEQTLNKQPLRRESSSVRRRKRWDIDPAVQQQRFQNMPSNDTETPTDRIRLIKAGTMHPRQEKKSPLQPTELQRPLIGGASAEVLTAQKAVDRVMRQLGDRQLSQESPRLRRAESASRNGNQSMMNYSLDRRDSLK